MHKSLLTLLFIFTLSACGGSSAKFNSPLPLGTNLPYRILLNGSHGNLSLTDSDYPFEPGTIALFSREDITAPSFRYSTEVTNALETVDYENSVALLILQGKQPQTNYSVFLQGIRLAGNTVISEVVFMTPGPYGAGDATTDPFLLVVLDRSAFDPFHKDHPPLFLLHATEVTPSPPPLTEP